MIKKSSDTKDTNALDLLIEDHNKVKKLFQQYTKVIKDKGSNAEKQEIATSICQELTIHAKLEEEMFYPKVRKLLDQKDLVDEAEVEHNTLKFLIAQIETMNPKEDLYDAKVIVLREYVEHHVEEEEGEMFPKVRKTTLDLEKLGEEMLLKKEKLFSDKPSGFLKTLGILKK